MRILVVDDDRAVRESLRRSLSFNGYSVELAQDG
ncbi:MAG: DNA-binding response regulator, partial [Mycobacterium sp.]